MRELHLFAGAGGGILGGQLLGHRTVCAVEIEPYCRKILLQRQRDGVLPWFPIWDDVRTFDGRPWRGIVDVVCGGFPCQDISAAGKGAGIDGERSGLWGEMARIIGEVRPRFAFVENSPMLTSRGLGRVLGDLSEMGFDARWGVVSAADAGAPHLRERIWILADAAGSGCETLRVRKIRTGQSGQVELCGGSMADAAGIGWTEGRKRAEQPGYEPDASGQEVADANKVGRHGRAGEQREGRRDKFEDGGWVRVSFAGDCDEDGFCAICGLEYAEECQCPGPTMDEYEYIERNGILFGRPVTNTQEQGLERPDATRDSWAGGFGSESGPGRRKTDWWATESELGRVAHGVANRVDRLKAIGNGQVPAVAALAWRILTKGDIE